jgi:hypothetical protein
MRPRYLILHCPAYLWFVLDRHERRIVADEFATQEAAEQYVATLVPEPKPKPVRRWRIVRDDEGVPVRLEF